LRKVQCINIDQEAKYFEKLNENSFENIDITGSGDEENLSNGY